MTKRAVNPLAKRRAGILLHPTSLPGTQQQGDLGAEAYHFVNFLVETGFSIWQVLPLHPPDKHDSPYVADSVHALDTKLASETLMREWGWSPDKLPDEPHEHWLSIYTHFHENASDADKALFKDFCNMQAHWLNDYALYRVIKDKHDGTPWFEWPPALRDRINSALEKTDARYREDIEAVKLAQFAVHRQWHALKHYANKHGVYLFGDMPVFVAHDSVEVWLQPDMFRLDDKGQPIVVAGVPPDYFSATGQRWGNPLYDWQHMQADDFAWWKDRLATQFNLFDVVRVDHFRGFESCWEIPAGDEDAMNGKWIPVPGKALFTSLKKHFSRLPLVAEDLGDITPQVEKLRRHFRFPGMRIIQFGYDGDPDNIHLPHNYDANTVVYTGTHDNDTIISWYDTLDDRTRELVDATLGSDPDGMPWPAIRAVLGSVAKLAVLPLQDVLGQGKEGRMNTPGVTRGNWQWRFDWSEVPPSSVEKVRRLNRIYART